MAVPRLVVQDNGCAEAVATNPDLDAGYDLGEPAGAALTAGETAGEACAGVIAGDAPGDDWVFTGAGEVWAGWFFISSRRKALLATLWCA